MTEEQVDAYIGIYDECDSITYLSKDAYSVGRALQSPGLAAHPIARNTISAIILGVVAIGWSR